MTPQRRNILLFHAGALGDFVVTWPLALALARVHPQSRVFYVTQRGKGALAERVLRLESADWDAGWHAMFIAPGEAPAKLLAGAHSIVSFMSSAGDAFSQNVARLSPGANYLPMTVSPAPGFAGHVSDHLLSQLAPWTAAHEALVQVLRSVKSRGVLGKAPDGRAVLVHPGSGARRKGWPAGGFVELIDGLRQAGGDAGVVVGEVGREPCPPAEIARLAGMAQVVRPESNVELLDELMKAGAYVGND